MKVSKLIFVDFLCNGVVWPSMAQGWFTIIMILVPAMGLFVKNPGVERSLRALG